MPKVHIVTGENRRRVVRDAFDALGDELIDRCKSASMILLKPDVESIDIEVLRGVLDVLRSYTGTPIVIADAAVHGTVGEFVRQGYNKLLDEYPKVYCQDLNDDEFVEGLITRVDGSTIAIRRSRMAVEAGLAISIAAMKPHSQLGAMLCVANWAHGTWLVPPRAGKHGMVWNREAWLEGAVDESIAQLFVHKPCDIGVIVGNNLALAGVDAVALDTVAATMMGIDPHALGYLERCAQSGFGINDLAKIDVPLGFLSSLN